MLPLYPRRFSSAFHTRHPLETMGVSWQTPDQRAFIEEHIASYIQHSANKTLKDEFWPEFFKKWFKVWPIPKPSTQQTEKGNEEDEMKEERAKCVAVSVAYPPTD